jgi:hypothetical protein
MLLGALLTGPLTPAGKYQVPQAESVTQYPPGSVESAGKWFL